MEKGFVIPITIDTVNAFKQIDSEFKSRKITISNFDVDTAFFMNTIKEFQKIANATNLKFDVDVSSVDKALVKGQALQKELELLNKYKGKTPLLGNVVSTDFVSQYIKQNKTAIEKIFGSVSSTVQNRYTTTTGAISAKFQKDYAEGVLYFNEIKDLSQSLTETTSKPNWSQKLSINELIQVYQQMAKVNELKERLMHGNPDRMGAGSLYGTTLSDGSKLFDLKNLNLTDLSKEVNSAYTNRIKSVESEFQSLINVVQTQSDAAQEHLKNFFRMLETGQIKIDTSGIETLKNQLAEATQRLEELKQKREEIKSKYDTAKDNGETVAAQKYLKQLQEIDIEIGKINDLKRNAVPDKINEEQGKLNKLNSEYERLYANIEKVVSGQIDVAGVVATLNKNEEQMKSMLTSTGAIAKGKKDEFLSLKQQSGMLYSYATQNGMDLTGLTAEAEKRASLFAQTIQYSAAEQRNKLEELETQRQLVSTIQQELGLEQQKSGIVNQNSAIKQQELNALQGLQGGTGTSSGTNVPVNIIPQVNLEEFQAKAQEIVNSASVKINTDPNISPSEFVEKVNSALSSSSAKINVQPQNVVDNKATVGTTDETSISREESAINLLNTQINNIIASISNKTEAFKQEEQVVTGTTQREISSLEALDGQLVLIKETIENITRNIDGIPSVSQKLNANNLVKGLNADAVDEKLTAMFTHFDDFAQSINNLKLNDSNILASINSILAKSEELKNLASVLQESKNKIESVGKSVKSTSTTSSSSITEQTSQIVQAVEQINKLESFINTHQNKADTFGADKRNLQYVQEYYDKLKQLNTLLDELKTKQSNGTNIINPEALNDIDKIKGDIIDLEKHLRLMTNNNHDLIADQEKIRTNMSKVSDILNKNTRMPDNIRQSFEALNKKYQLAIDTKASEADVKNLNEEFATLQYRLKASGKTGRSFFDLIATKARSASAYILGFYLSFYRVIMYVRKAITTIKELDTALIDLKKTTTMTNAQLEDFYLDSNRVAKEMGVTTKSILEQAAAWSRLNNIGLLYGNI